MGELTVDEEMDRAEAPGWPRPRSWWRPEHGEARRLPIPWLAGINALGNQWASMRDDCARAHEERLCSVCGEHLDGTVVLLTLSSGVTTSGPGGHARCMLLAARSCPHLAMLLEMQPERACAFAWDGEGAGYGSPCMREHPETPYAHQNRIMPGARPLRLAELRALAREDPLGVGRAEAAA